MERLKYFLIRMIFLSIGKLFLIPTELGFFFILVHAEEGLLRRE